MRKILNNSRIYNFYQNLIGCKKFQKNFSNNFIKARAGENVLELGCGTGNVARFLNQNVNYIGVDYCKNYIDYASKKYPHFKFKHADLSSPITFDCKFDIIYAEAILSAMTDEQALNMFKIINSHINNNTRIIFSDMNYNCANSAFEKYMFEHERNSVIRTKDEYIALIQPSFKIQNITVLDHIYRIPYSKLIFECEPLKH